MVIFDDEPTPVGPCVMVHSGILPARLSKKVNSFNLSQIWLVTFVQ
jgi:hypothetical protein